MSTEMVILEGADKSGKSTVYQHFRRKTDYQPFVWDRGVGSNYVYDRVYQRKPCRTQEYLEEEARILGHQKVFVAYLEADSKEIARRIHVSCLGHLKEGLDGDGGSGNLTGALQFYEDYLSSTPMLYTRIDTFKTSIEDTSVRILTALNRLRGLHNELGFHWLMAIRRVMSAGDEAVINQSNKDTQELVDMEITLSLNGLDAWATRSGMSKKYIDLYDRYCDQMLHQKKTQEVEYHASLFHTMRHKIRSTWYFFKEGKDSRKNIIFCDDCISSIQFMHRNGVGHLWVHMRSSDVLNLLPADLECIVGIARDSAFQKSEDVIIHIRIASAHIYRADWDKALKLNGKLEEMWNNGEPLKGQ